MNTLIELYDERVIENVLGPETFKPHKVIYLCPDDMVNADSSIRILRRFFRHRGLTADISFLRSSIFDSHSILEQLQEIASHHSDCALDITGGTDAGLFAAGMFCSETGVPTFTYSRRNNSFFNIFNAPFADKLHCVLEYSVEDFLLMAGGTLREGRNDNSVLTGYFNCIDSLFDIFLRYSRQWNSFISYIQKISNHHSNDSVPLYVCGKWYQNGEHGKTLYPNIPLLQELESIGLILNLQFTEGEGISFSFLDHNIRSWLRDVGSVLELYIYKACHDAGIFNDIVSSAIVDWDGTNTRGSVSNEIDCVAVKGVVPLFISCKACEVKTDAINELAILADRFGGKGSKAVIATTEPCGAAARHRAAQLGIAILDREELENGKASKRLRVIMKEDAFLQ